MKLKWILICLLVAVGITGCKGKEEPSPEPIHYYDGLWVANSLGDTTANPDYLLFVEGEKQLYAVIDWNELCICLCDDNVAEQYQNLTFTYCAPLSDDRLERPSWEGFFNSLTPRFISLALEAPTAYFIINGIVNNNLGLYQKALQVKSLSELLKTNLNKLSTAMGEMFKHLSTDLENLEKAVKKVDEARAISLRQNRLAYYHKCNDDLVNEQQIVFSRSYAYFNTINALLKDTIGKAREDTVNFYRRLDPVVSEWAGEGGIYIDQVKNLMDKMVTTYSVSSLGQSTYDVGMPSIYENFAKWIYPDEKEKEKRDQLVQSLLARDINNMFYAFYLTDIYCQTKIYLYNSIEAETTFKEFKALKTNFLQLYQQHKK